MSDNKLHATSWTEIEYPVTSKNPFRVEPIFEPKDVRYILCRTNGERVESRLSFAVFNTLDGTEDDWEDDPMLGHIRMQVLGDGDEEVEPVEVYYLDLGAKELLSLESEDEKTLTFNIYWPDGDVNVPKAISSDNDLYVINRSEFEDGKTIEMILTPDDGEPFSLHIQIPFTGFQLLDENGVRVCDDVDIDAKKAENWSYSFVGTPDKDRFSIVLDNDRLNYICIWREDGLLTVRNQHDHMAVVGEIPSEGSLRQLMQGARTVFIKFRNMRQTVSLTDNTFDVEGMPECNAVALARFAFEKFIDIDADGEETLANDLITLETKMFFQWYWLNEADWSHENMEGMLDMSDLDSNPEKMMQQALLFNRYESFMKKLRMLSYMTQDDIQGDKIRERNNKRKILRSAKSIAAHQQGIESLWDKPVETRQEILLLFHLYHQAFTETLESL